MKTVDVLRATLVLFSDPTNWATGQLRARKPDAELTDTGTDSFCFCALGGIIQSGGLFEEKYGTLRPKSDAEVDSCGGLVGVHVNGYIVHAKDFGALSQAVIKEYASRGAHILATAKAQAYLQAAVNKLAGRHVAIYQANDEHETVNGFGYNFIMRALKLAIRNAARRHINGDWSKTTKRQSRRASAIQAVA